MNPLHRFPFFNVGSNSCVDALSCYIHYMKVVSMLSPKLAQWQDMKGSVADHPLTFDEAFSRAKVGFSRFRWNYAVIFGVTTLLVLLPHPELIAVFAFVVYVPAVLYTDVAPAPAFFRDIVPAAHRAVVVGCVVVCTVLCTDLVMYLIVGLVMGGAVCAAHAVYIEPPVSFDV